MYVLAHLPGRVASTHEFDLCSPRCSKLSEILMRLNLTHARNRCAKRCLVKGDLPRLPTSGYGIADIGSGQNLRVFKLPPCKGKATPWQFDVSSESSPDDTRASDRDPAGTYQ